MAQEVSGVIGDSWLKRVLLVLLVYFGGQVAFAAVS